MRTIAGLVIGFSLYRSLRIDHYQPRAVSSVIADCLLGDEYVKIFNHREHRGTQGK
jgi:hypothetical protein